MLTFKGYQTMRLLSLCGLFFFLFLSFHVLSFFSVIDCFMPDKKQCMANEAHNGQIWLTCQCRGEKEEAAREGEGQREGHREGEEEAWGRWENEGDRQVEGEWKRRKKRGWETDRGRGVATCAPSYNRGSRPGICRHSGHQLTCYTTRRLWLK